MAGTFERTKRRHLQPGELDYETQTLGRGVRFGQGVVWEEQQMRWHLGVDSRGSSWELGQPQHCSRANGLALQASGGKFPRAPVQGL